MCYVEGPGEQTEQFLLYISHPTIIQIIDGVNSASVIKTDCCNRSICCRECNTCALFILLLFLAIQRWTGRMRSSLSTRTTATSDAAHKTSDAYRRPWPDTLWNPQIREATPPGRRPRWRWWEKWMISPHFISFSGNTKVRQPSPRCRYMPQVQQVFSVKAS